MVDDSASARAGSRSARGERTRQRLLEAGRSAFADSGWSKARVEDVCRIAGVAHGTFYGHFRNRTEILAALVRQHALDLYLLVESEWGGDEGTELGLDRLRSDVRRVIDGFLHLAVRDRDVRELWYSAAPSEPELSLLVDEVRRQFVARIASHLRAGIESGSARAELDPEVASTSLVAMVEQTVISVLRRDPASGIEQVPPEPLISRWVDGLTDLWVHAVYAAPPA